MTIEIFLQAQKKYDPMTPPTHNRFFLFILQHYRDRLQYIFQRAGASVEDYNQVLEYFDKRGGALQPTKSTGSTRDTSYTNGRRTRTLSTVHSRTTRDATTTQDAIYRRKSIRQLGVNYEGIRKYEFEEKE
eukprot:6456004-Amphidinium_carterae.1